MVHEDGGLGVVVVVESHLHCTLKKIEPLEIFEREWKPILQESGIFCKLCCWPVAELCFNLYNS